MENTSFTSTTVSAVKKERASRFSQLSIPSTALLFLGMSVSPVSAQSSSHAPSPFMSDSAIQTTTIFSDELPHLPDASGTLPAPLQASSPSLLSSPSPSVNSTFSIDTTYLLGSGDLVRIDVFNIPDYSGELRVLAGGSLNLPVAGLVTVEGLTLQQAAEQIELSLAPFVRRPRVTLSVLAIRPLQIAIAGEVNRPGAYQVDVNGRQNTAAEVPTLTQAIELAGGITQLADIRQIEVQRRLAPDQSSSPSGSQLIISADSTQAQFQSIPIDLWALLKEGNLSEDIRLQDGDRISIPKATTFNSSETAEIASASFSPTQIAVNVVGEVAAPGTISVPPNTPLNQAILAAGGFNNRAKTGTVSLVRLNPNGTASQQEITIDFAQGINTDANPYLLPNDTIIVQRSGLTRVGDSVRTLLSPISDTFRVLRLFGL